MPSTGFKLREKGAKQGLLRKWEVNVITGTLREDCVKVKDVFQMKLQRYDVLILTVLEFSCCAGPLRE